MTASESATAGPGTDRPTAERIDVHGVVQGVGFRPFVHALANELGLVGHVGNDASRVFIEVAGPAAAIGRLVERLTSAPPPLARIDRVVRTSIGAPSGPDPGPGSGPGPRFEIVESRPAAGSRTLVAPDTATCADCLAELFDPDDRRHRHPFITCTNCGPRFTIVTDLPYDRAATTMAPFPLCPPCRAEYEDPGDRRFHAQPIACHACGPTLSFRPADPGVDPVAAAAVALDRGAIVAIKGLGGYHLACRADDDAPVAELRRRKHRADKPFAVMVADLDQARRLAEIGEAEAGLLTSRAAPIVLLRARPDSPLSPVVAPDNPLVGVMLASTPLHHLVLAAIDRPLVMTSANRGGEPLAWSAATLEPLADLFDAVLDHDRGIHQPCDDSVVRVVARRLLPLRRARGYAPLPIAFPAAARPVLATGAELKNTFCVGSGGVAWVSQHIGDMGNLATLEAFAASVGHYGDLYRVEPATVAADAHPSYLSSRWARRHHGDRLVEIQHHHAHVASVMAEHQLDPTEPVLGFAFDGTGFGPDGTIWGGEVLDVTVEGFERVAHLAPILLPGGDAAIEHPARVALAHLYGAGIPWEPGLAPVDHLEAHELVLLARMLEAQINTVPTTSMGRLFDAVASLAGLRHRIGYEAQAAIDLEIAAVAGRRCDDPGYRFAVEAGVIATAPVLSALVADLRGGVAAPTVAWRFHRAVVDVVEAIATAHRDRTGRTTVALTGGVFQNALLTELCVDALAGHGLRALTNALVPPNDGGLALGQAFIAANRSTDAHHP